MSAEPIATQYDAVCVRLLIWCANRMKGMSKGGSEHKCHGVNQCVLKQAGSRRDRIE